MFRKLFSRKPSTVLDVVAGPDEAYDDLVASGLVTQTPIYAQLRAEFDAAVA